MSVRRRYLVCYDISDPIRLRAVHSVMVRYGEPAQYSVFICDLSHQEVLALRVHLGQVINHAWDRVLFADLGETSGPGRISFFGRSRPLPRKGGATII